MNLKLDMISRLGNVELTFRQMHFCQLRLTKTDLLTKIVMVNRKVLLLAKKVINIVIAR